MTTHDVREILGFTFIFVILCVIPFWGLYKAGVLSWSWEEVKEFFSLNKSHPKPKNPPERP